MDGLTLATIAATTSTTTRAYSSIYGSKSLFSPVSNGIGRKGKRRQLNYSGKNQFIVFCAAQDDPKFDQWDQMELKFGRMLGEDPKLTLAKIMAKKANPDVSFLEVEKQFYKNKGKIVEIKELPFDGSKDKNPSNSVDGLKLVKPIPKGGFELPIEEKPVTSLIKKPNRPISKPVDSNTKPSVPNVILRKPSMYVQDDVEDMPSRLRVKIQPNLTLKMRNDQSYDKFSDMTLLRKPDPSALNRNQGSLEEVKAKAREDEFSRFALLKNSEATKSEDGEPESFEIEQSSVIKLQEPEYVLKQGMQLHEESNVESIKESADGNTVEPALKFSVDAALLGKPKRLDNTAVETSNLTTEETTLTDPEKEVADELTNLLATSPVEDADWSRAEDLLRTGNRGEVELVSASTRGFIVSFGSLVGFLPYRNLATKWKFLAFESWMKQKGLDPSFYRQNIGSTGNFDISNQKFSDSNVNSRINQNVGEEITPDMKLEDLLSIYDQEKLKFLTSFVGQKIKANIIVADRKMRTFTVSLRPKEKEESIKKKRNLMTRLQVGDIVKCCIKKITFFGIFVEVEGVIALIHQTEVSWDSTLDPTSYFKVGQIVDAKVIHLDFTLERISLSLKDITPDPLAEAFESVVGDIESLDRLQAAEAESEWPDVEALIKELEKIEGIQSVTKGRFFLSPGLAPTFQVYMASMLENQYKLLARAGNKVQEVIVEATLDKEEMKSTILSCTNGVS